MTRNRRTLAILAPTSCDEFTDPLRLVLAIAVDGHQEIIPVLRRVAKCRGQCSPIAHVPRMRDQLNVRASVENLAGAVAGTIIHNQHMRDRGYPEVAERVQELYLAGRKQEAIDAIPDEYVDEVPLSVNDDPPEMSNVVSVTVASGPASIAPPAADRKIPRSTVASDGNASVPAVTSK